MSGYKMFDALKTKYENKINQHSAHIAKLWRYYKNEGPRRGENDEFVAKMTEIGLFQSKLAVGMIDLR